jgi:hypothetical protein
MKRHERDPCIDAARRTGFVTNFFDTLGIGSFATTTAAYRLLRLVPDELIPGTLNVGHTLPVVAQALFFISVIAVDPWQMTALIGVCVTGEWLGAGVVASLSRRAVRLGMGCALLVAAVFMALGVLGRFPAGGVALEFTTGAFAVALAVNFILGGLLTLGIGNYAPSLVLFSVLGMDPRAAFPMRWDRVRSAQRSHGGKGDSDSLPRPRAHARRQHHFRSAGSHRLSERALFCGPVSVHQRRIRPRLAARVGCGGSA